MPLFFHPNSLHPILQSFWSSMAPPCRPLLGAAVVSQAIGRPRGSFTHDSRPQTTTHVGTLGSGPPRRLVWEAWKRESPPNSAKSEAGVAGSGGRRVSVRLCRRQSHLREDASRGDGVSGSGRPRYLPSPSPAGVTERALHAAATSPCSSHSPSRE